MPALHCFLCADMLVSHGCFRSCCHTRHWFTLLVLLPRCYSPKPNISCVCLHETGNSLGLGIKDLQPPPSQSRERQEDSGTKAVKALDDEQKCLFRLNKKRKGREFTCCCYHIHRLTAVSGPGETKWEELRCLGTSDREVFPEWRWHQALGPAVTTTESELLSWQTRWGCFKQSTVLVCLTVPQNNA